MCIRDRCTPVKAGYWSPTGSVKKEACPAGTYNPDAKSSSVAACVPCGERRTTLSNASRQSAECLCEEGLYEGGDGECQLCPVATDCVGQLGLTSEDLPILPGYWRASSTSTDIQRCTVTGACLGSDRCAEGHYGPLCSLCNTSEGRHFNADENACLPCAFRLGATSAAVGVVVGVVALLGLVGARVRSLLRRRKLRQLLAALRQLRSLKDRVLGRVAEVAPAMGHAPRLLRYWLSCSLLSRASSSWPPAASFPKR